MLGHSVNKGGFVDEPVLAVLCKLLAVEVFILSGRKLEKHTGALEWFMIDGLERRVWRIVLLKVLYWRAI